MYSCCDLCILYLLLNLCRIKVISLEFMGFVIIMTLLTFVTEFRYKYHKNGFLKVSKIHHLTIT